MGKYRHLNVLTKHGAIKKDHVAQYCCVPRLQRRSPDAISSQNEKISFVHEKIVNRKKYIRNRTRAALKAKNTSESQVEKDHSDRDSSGAKYKHSIITTMGIIPTLVSPFVSKKTQHELESDQYRKKIYPVVESITDLEDIYRSYSPYQLGSEVLNKSKEWQSEFRPMFQKIQALEIEFDSYPDETLDRKEIKERWKKRKELKKLKTEFERRVDEILPEAFAMIRESAKRSSVDQFPDENQLFVGVAVHKGYIAEFPTGEGKTLSGVVPACFNALWGQVHMVTVNDYLTRYQGQFYGPVYETLGLTVGLIMENKKAYIYDSKYINPEAPDESWKNLRQSTRKEVYEKSDVIYGQGKEFVFDFLHDTNSAMSKNKQCQKGHHFAIIDEPDSLLIDSARIPCRISDNSGDEIIAKRIKADEIIKSGKLKKNTHYKAIKTKRMITFTDDGIKKAEELVGVGAFYGGNGNQVWEDCIKQALYVENFMKNESDFFILNNEIIVINEITERPMPGMRWNDGIHQALEAKYGLPVRSEGLTLASSTMANYFKRYSKKSGMTGTALVDAPILKKIYNLNVVQAPHTPVKRRDYENINWFDDKEQMEHLIEEVVNYYKIGRPVLLGTIGIKDTEKFSRELSRRGIPHEVLNAKHLHKEAGIIKKAGGLSKVTISTNMAGRGTDIIIQKCDGNKLFDHWKKTGIAPAKLSYNDPQRNKKLLKHWAKIFLNNMNTTKMRTEDIELELEIYWAGRNMKQLPTDLKDIENINDIGGLHVIGTERHDAVRIDNQLRGRSGRRGSEGSSRFHVCVYNNKLLEKYAPRKLEKEEADNWGQQIKDATRFRFTSRADKINTSIRYPYKLQKALDNHKTGQPIKTKSAKKFLDKVQREATQTNNELVEWCVREDTILNYGRNVLHRERQKIINNGNNKNLIIGIMTERLDDILNDFLPENKSRSKWNFAGLRKWIRDTFHVQIDIRTLSRNADGRINDFNEVHEKIIKMVEESYERREKQVGSEKMRKIEQHVLLSAVNYAFQDYQDVMDSVMMNVRTSLIGNSQGDPKDKYFQKLGKANHKIYGDMRADMQAQIVRSIFTTWV